MNCIKFICFYFFIIFKINELNLYNILIDSTYIVSKLKYL